MLKLTSNSIVTRCPFILKLPKISRKVSPVPNRIRGQIRKLLASTIHSGMPRHGVAGNTSDTDSSWISGMLLPPTQAICATVLALSLLIPICAAVTFLLQHFPFQTLLAVVLSEAIFSAWWWLVQHKRLSAPPEVHAPYLHNPEQAFSRMLTLARTIRTLGTRQAPPSGTFHPGCGKLEVSPMQFDASSGHEPPVDMRLILSWWFSGADFSSVLKGNVAELLTYAFYYKTM